MPAPAVVLFFNNLTQHTPPHYPFVTGNDDLKMKPRWDHTCCLYCTLEGLNQLVLELLIRAISFQATRCLLGNDVWGACETSSYRPPPPSPSGYWLVPPYPPCRRRWLNQGWGLEARAIPKVTWTCSTYNKPEYWKSESFNLYPVAPSDGLTNTMWIMYGWFQH